MKKCIIFLLFLSNTFIAPAQLEVLMNAEDSIYQREHFIKPLQQGILLYYQNNRTGDPAQLEQMIMNFQETTLYPGMSVCILRDGKVYWKNHYGWANIAESRLVNDQTAYTLASISKTIMITAVMQLYEQGLFELDDDVSDHIPFLVRNPNHPESIITIRQLMTHTSSIADYYGVLDAVLYIGGDNPIAMDAFLQGYFIEGGEYYSNNNFYTYAPGASWNYSNVGSCLLAYMVECLTGLDFETYCQTNIFGPLSMEGTSYFFSSLDPENLATPYTIQGTNVIVTPQSSWPIYPIGNLKTSALQLAKHLGMYMNYGQYGNATIIDSTTVELITELNYTNDIDIYEGLIWQIDPVLNFYWHTGRWYGFNTIYGFNKLENYGMIWLANGDNMGVWDQLNQFWANLILYSRQYKPFSIETMTINDTDGDHILEPGEDIDLCLGIRNNTNMSDMAADVMLSISTDCPAISFTGDTVINYGDVAYLEELQNLGNPIKFKIGNNVLPGNINFNLLIKWNEEEQYSSGLELYAGQSDILVVKDETDFRGDLILTWNWYLEALDSLNYDYQYYDISFSGDPAVDFLNGFKAVVWLTGYDHDSTLTVENQQVLSAYLDNGGKLFLTGQNISEDISGSAFLLNYLHATHVADTWYDMMIVRGVESDPIGGGIMFKISNTSSSETGADNQESPSVIDANFLTGGEKCFGYFPDLEACGVRYEGNYKTVFLSFGFEAISTKNARVEVMKRILEYFDLYVGEKDIQVAGSRLKVEVYPNPASGISDIRYQISDIGYVAIAVFDNHGQKILNLVDKEQSAGDYTIRFDASELASGIYLISLQAGDAVVTRKLVVIR